MFNHDDPMKDKKSETLSKEERNTDVFPIITGVQYYNRASLNQNQPLNLSTSD